MLQGEEQFDEENEETSLFESASPLIKEPVPVEYNPSVPKRSSNPMRTRPKARRMMPMFLEADTCSDANTFVKMIGLLPDLRFPQV